MSAAVASECNPISFALARKIWSSSKVAVGVSRLDDCQAHAGERIDVRHLAGMAAESDVPRAPAGLHRMVDGGAALALDHVAGPVGLLDDQQLLIERVGDGGRDRRQRTPARDAAHLSVHTAPTSRNPVSWTRLVPASSLVKRRSVRYSAKSQSSVPALAGLSTLSDAPPDRQLSKAGSKTGFGALDRRVIVDAESLAGDRATGPARPCRRVEEMSPSPVSERLAPHIAGQGQGGAARFHF